MRKKLFVKGLRDGVPIMLGYFAVSFALGISARRIGLSIVQAGMASLLNNASAGEFGGFSVIAADSGYWAMAVMMLVVNARYMLMSCALSQKLPPETGIGHRLLLGFDLTDEIFAVSMAFPGPLDPFYTYGVMLCAAPGWTFGTMLGALMGSVLPDAIVRALSVGLYGMFLAIIIPPARKSRVIAGVVAAAMALSFAASRLPLTKNVAAGTRIIVLTVAVSVVAALLFPVKDGDAAETDAPHNETEETHHAQQ